MKLNKLIVLSAVFFLILPLSVLADQGFLKIEVTDCSTGSAIKNARVEIQNDPEYTDRDGQAYFVLDEGTYTVEVSKSDYTTKSTRVTVREDDVTVKEICLRKTECEISVNIDVDVEDNEVTSTIKLTNRGDRGQYVTVRAYVCDSDYTDCKTMRCENKVDPRVWVSAHGTSRLTCEKEIRAEDDYRVKVSYTACGRTRIKYSSAFEVPLDCEKEYLDEFGCFGNYRRQLYQFSDCSTEWKNIRYCSYGCESGFCLPKSAAEFGEPIIILDKEYEAKACEVSVFSFDLKNIGKYEGRFNIEVTGDASGWIHVPSTVSLDEGERRTMIGYISLPCDIEGKYQFTISASDKTWDSDTGMIKVIEKEEAGFPISSIILGIVVGFVIVLIIVIVVRFLRRLQVPRPKEERF